MEWDISKAHGKRDRRTFGFEKLVLFSCNVPLVLESECNSELLLAVRRVTLLVKTHST